MSKSMSLDAQEKRFVAGIGKAKRRRSGDRRLSGFITSSRLGGRMRED
jgi:hypothetical protein